MTERLEISGSRLRIVAFSVGDRFSHGLEVLRSAGSNDWIRLLTSVEGSSEDRWPPCPAIQEYLPHHEEESKSLLGVGGSGVTHYSAAISVSQVEHDVKLEFAARVKSQPESLGCTYKVGDEVDAKLSQESVTLTTDSIAVVFKPMLEASLNSPASDRIQVAASLSPIDSDVTIQFGCRIRISE